MKKRGRKQKGPVTIDPEKVEVLPAIEEDPEIDSDGAPLTISAEEGSEVDDSILDDLASEPDDAPAETTELPARRLADIVPFDTLEAYLREIGRFPALSREEEREVALKFYHEKDVEAARTLITSNLWLVVKIAREYQSAAKNLLDLIQEGNIGLMEAVKNFDPYRNVRFPSYASWWIKAYVIRYVIANLRMVKIGTTQAQRKLFFNLRKEKEKLERDGFFPAPKLLAEKLNVRESDVVEMEQRLLSPDVSVNAPLGDTSENDLLSILPSDSMTAEDAVLRKEMREQILSSLEEFSSTLKEKEKVIFKERLLGEEKATLQELADKFSLSRERIRQIENRLRDRLKTFLVSRFGAAMENRDFNI